MENYLCFYTDNLQEFTLDEQCFIFLFISQYAIYMQSWQYYISVDCATVFVLLCLYQLWTGRSDDCRLINRSNSFLFCTFLGFCMSQCVSAHLCQNQSLKCTGRSNLLCTLSLTLPTCRSSGTSLSLRATRFDSPSHIWILKLLRTATTTHLQSDPYFNTYTELP